MIFSYRTRRALKRLLILLLALAVIGIGVLMCWLLWLQRYVVYTPDGAILDFDKPLEYAPGSVATPTEPLPTVNIHYSDPDNDQPEITELERFSGYYVTLETLLSDFDNVSQKLRKLPANTGILLDVKSVSSYSYFSTDVGMRATDFDTAKLDSLIQDLRSRGHYLIARIPAFQEYRYILADERERVPYGLPKDGGNGSLWLDADGPCYWMNPASEGAISYLIQTINELRQLGFDEVLLDNFRFPRTDMIPFILMEDEVLVEAAQTVVKACATDSFCVSFVQDKVDLSLSEGRVRLYIEGATILDAPALLEQSGMADPAVQVVFLTDTGDTRFDEYCVLRPIEMAHD
ncbi:MAG: hypothetical protein IJE24_05755 [Oscillospiraceae bacterium]|nr:hypothetical protein [Oscillospiraceae bacterium]